MAQPVKVVGFVGSPRKNSHKKALMCVAVAMISGNTAIEVF